MERYNGWNIFSMDDLIGRKVKVTYNTTTEPYIIATADSITAKADPHPFKCPNCGGNSYYTDAEGRVTCEYCGTMFTFKNQGELR